MRSSFDRFCCRREILQCLYTGLNHRLPLVPSLFIKFYYLFHSRFSRSTVSESPNFQIFYFTAQREIIRVYGSNGVTRCESRCMIIDLLSVNGTQIFMRTPRRDVVDKQVITLSALNFISIALIGSRLLTKVRTTQRKY